MSLIDSIQQLPFLYLTAAYATITSTLVLLWDVHKWRQSKRSDRVQFTITLELYVGQNGQSLGIAIKNTGKRATKISSFRICPMSVYQGEQMPNEDDGLKYFQDIVPKFGMMNEGDIFSVSTYEQVENLKVAMKTGFAIYIEHTFSKENPTRLLFPTNERDSQRYCKVVTVP